MNLIFIGVPITVMKAIFDVSVAAVKMVLVAIAICAVVNFVGVLENVVQGCVVPQVTALVALVVALATV